MFVYDGKELPLESETTALGDSSKKKGISSDAAEDADLESGNVNYEAEKAVAIRNGCQECEICEKCAPVPPKAPLIVMQVCGLESKFILEESSCGAFKFFCSCCLCCFCSFLCSGLVQVLLRGLFLDTGVKY